MSQLTPVTEELIGTLRSLRSRQDITLKPSPYISGKIRNFAGEIVDVNVRNYQAQMILTLVKMKEFIVGDEPGLGKTLEMMHAYGYLKMFYPKLRMIWIGPKTTITDKEDEIRVMLNQISPMTILGGKGAAKRRKQWAMVRTQQVDVVLCNYSILRTDYDEMALAMADSQYMIVGDEIQVISNVSTKVHKAFAHLCKRADRKYGITATIVRNRLAETYGVFKPICPGLFPNKAWFEKSFCVFEQLRFGKKRVSKLSGHKNLPVFRTMIEPYFLSRTPREVGGELPEIVPKKVSLEMTGDQAKYYDQCALGVLNKTTHNPYTGEDEETKIEGSLSILMYSMLISCAIQMIPGYEHTKGYSAKEEKILEYLGGDLSNEKVVVFSFFKKWLYRLNEITQKELGFKPLMLTGDTKIKERDEVKARFNQNDDDDSRVVFITMAGGVGINLTIAKYMLLPNYPWSYGDFRQIAGRISRLGSLHSQVLAIFLSNQRTIDDHVLNTLRSKQDLSQAVHDDSITSLGDLSGGDIDKIIIQFQQEIMRRNK